MRNLTRILLSMHCTCAHTRGSFVQVQPLSPADRDGEVFVDVDTPAEDYNFAHDPKVYADFNASGLSNWLTYWSTWRVRLTKAATDPYMADETLRSGILKGT